MNYRMTILGAAGLLALSACGGSGGEGQGNGASAAKGGAGGGEELAATLQPGAYEVTTEFVTIEGPNLPPAVAESMKGQKETKRNCVTQADLDKSKGGLFADEEQAKECSKNDISLANGRMTGSMTCGSGDQASTFEVDGRYSANTYEADMKMTVGGATTRIKMNARRVGDCTAEEAGQAEQAEG